MRALLAIVALALLVSCDPPIDERSTDHGTRTHELPRTSEETSPTGAAASRQTAATARSCPEGPGVVSRRSSSSGRGMAAGHYLRPPRVLRGSVSA